jgi:hypothetical protein
MYIYIEIYKHLYIQRKHNKMLHTLFEKGDEEGVGKGNIMGQCTCSKCTVLRFGVTKMNPLILLMHTKSKI